MAGEILIVMAKTTNTQSAQTPLVSTDVTIYRGRVGSVILYEVKENELDVLERGGQADIYLNFAIFLISLAITAISALFTASFPKPIVQIVFICITIIGFILGGLLLILWARSRKPVKSVIEAIKGRVPDTSCYPDTNIEIQNNLDITPTPAPTSKK